MIRRPIMLLVFLALAIPVLAFDARAFDPAVGEANMTRADYDGVTRIAAADGDAGDASLGDALLPVHNLNDIGRNDLRQAGGTKVVAGRQWHRQSSERRLALLRDLRQAMPDAFFLLLVPKGDVWAIPRASTTQLRDEKRAFRPWTREEYESLPEHLHLQPQLKHQGGKGNKGKTVQ